MGIYVDARKVRAPKEMMLRFRQGPALGVGKMKGGAELAQSSLGAATFYAPPMAPTAVRQTAGGAVAQPYEKSNAAPVVPMVDDKMVDIDWVCLISI